MTDLIDSIAMKERLFVDRSGKKKKTQNTRLKRKPTLYCEGCSAQVVAHFMLTSYKFSTRSRKLGFRPVSSSYFWLPIDTRYRQLYIDFVTTSAEIYLSNC